MRFLCLHGMGTNSDIFESQLAAFFSRISPHHTFDFVDAPFESPPAPGIGGLYPPPYLAWHSEYEPEQIKDSHDFLQTVIDEDGPYDGVIGFSQGAALAASFLLCNEHTRKQADQGSFNQPPFKLAVFLNSVMLFSPSAEIGDDISEEIRQQEQKHLGFLQGDAPETPGRMKGSTIFGFRPATFPQRISIPTLHVIGRNDQFAEHSHALVELCRSERAEVVISTGGHEPPRTDSDLEACAKLFEVMTLMASIS